MKALFLLHYVFILKDNDKEVIFNFIKTKTAFNQQAKAEF
ncbi:hypothetical protein LACWKB10_0782 [Lactobacillus sp. wkB10]|nr:hypothetical protein LACWKB10_0782 [Lactobacillus sp. wkB10]